jgi:NAD(P)-dependent dehydrogenase (short-subunit alcohol dehydrogenase family)
MTGDADNRVWLITGASRGLGKAFAEEALAHGDRVAVTVRELSAVADLARGYGDQMLTIELDVTDHAAVLDAVATVVDRWGQIDVLVNNAGYGLAGAIEEVSEERARRQMEVNFFGALWCTQATLPHMRRQGGGHIFQISSVGGLTSQPNTGLYCASKWALEGMSESLAMEVAPFGIHVTIVEPGPFRTDWNGNSMERADPNPAYNKVLAARREILSGAHAGTQPGDPERAAAALRTMLDAEQPPLRLLLGVFAADHAPRIYQERLAEWGRWDELARSADFEVGSRQ